MLRRALVVVVPCLWVFLALPVVEAAPLRGDSRFFAQPDGTEVEVRLFGTEFYMRAESPDGYTLVVDRPSGWICYAETAADGSLESSGIPYLGAPAGTVLGQLAQRGIAPGLRANAAVVAARVAAVRQSFASGPAQTSEFPIAEATYGPGSGPVLGTGKGLVVLVDFSDRAGTIPVSEFDKAFNGDTYDSLGSIRSWIEAISYSKYTASHTVVGYMRAAYPTSHYVGGVEFDYSASRELMKQVYAYIDENIDLTDYATNGSMPSLVVIYPGAEIAKVWATGLWPHAGEGGYRTSEGVRIPNAFISNSGTRTPMSLYTYRHELGHSLFSWPDTYDYDDDSAGAGGFATETTLPCAPMRAWAGWMNVIDVVGLNQAFALPANGDTCLRYKNASNASEFFMVEYMRKESPRRSDAPDEGLLIWHVDEKGDNSAQDMTARKHYVLSVEQADGLFELEKNGRKRVGDLFRAGYKDKFDDTTTPDSKWWSGSASGFAVCDVGALEPSMNVTVGCSGPITPIADAGAGGAGGSSGSGGRSASGGAAGSGGRSAAGGQAGSGGRGGAGGAASVRDAGADVRNRPTDVAPDLGRGGAGGQGGTTSGTRPASGGESGSGGSGMGGARQAGGVAAGGAAGSGGSAGTQSSGGSSAGGSSGSGGASSSAGGSKEAGQKATEQGGCSCALGARSASMPVLPLGLLLAILLLRRRSGRR